MRNITPEMKIKMEEYAKKYPPVKVTTNYVDISYADYKAGKGMPAKVDPKKMYSAEEIRQMLPKRSDAFTQTVYRITGAPQYGDPSGRGSPFRVNIPRDAKAASIVGKVCKGGVAGIGCRRKQKTNKRKVAVKRKPRGR